MSQSNSQSARFDGNGDRSRDRDRVLEGTNLVELIGESIQLKPKGREFVGLCPFHADRTPSFAVITHKGSGFYNCFACGAGGNCYDFMMNYHKMEFIDALKFLAARINYELTAWKPTARAVGEPTREEVIRANALALKFFRRILQEPAGAVARSEAQKRSYSQDVLEQFELGAAPDRSDGLLEAYQRARSDPQWRDHVPPFEAFVAAGLLRASTRGEGHYDFLRNRLIFPIFDEIGRPIAFGGRRLKPEDEPKYVNSPESSVFHKSRTLYALHQARRSIIDRGVAIVTEGYTDVIACHRAGYTNTVATLGTAFTREHATKLALMAPRVTLLFDGDEAGQKAADRAIEVFFQVKIDVHICTLPDRLDPDDLLKQENGPARFEEAMRKSVTALNYMLTRLRKQAEKCDGISETQSLAEKTALRLAELGFANMPGIRRQLVLDTLAPTLRISSKDLETEVLALAAKMSARGKSGESPLATASTAANTPVGRSIATRSPKERAQISAQGHLLAPLVTDPSLAKTPVAIAGEGSLPISEALALESFVLPEHREIWRAIVEAAESNKTLRFASLLSEIEGSEAQRTARALVLELDKILRPHGLVGVPPRSEEPTIDELRAALRSAWKILEGLSVRHQPNAFGSNSSPMERLDGGLLARDHAPRTGHESDRVRANGLTEVRGDFFHDSDRADQTDSTLTSDPHFHMRPTTTVSLAPSTMTVVDSSGRTSQNADSVLPVQSDSAETAPANVVQPVIVPPVFVPPVFVPPVDKVCSSADALTETRMHNMRARGADPTAIRRLPKSGNLGANP